MPAAMSSSLEAGELAVDLEVVLADVGAGQQVRLEVGARSTAPGSGRTGRSPNTAWSVVRQKSRAASCGSAIRSPASCTRAGRHAVGLQRRRPPASAVRVAHHSRRRASISAARAIRPPTVASVGSLGEVGDVPRRPCRTAAASRRRRGR